MINPVCISKLRSKKRIDICINCVESSLFYSKSSYIPFAGVWVDRFDRKKIILIADFTQGLISFFLVFSLLWLDAQSIVWLIFLFASCISLLNTIHGLALSSSYIMILPKKHLNRASSMMTTMLTLTGALAPIISASILSFSKNNGIIWVFLVDAVTFILSGLCLLFLKIPSPDQNNIEKVGSKGSSSFWLDLKSGMVYLLKYPSFLWLLFLTFIVNIVYCSEILLPVIVKDVYLSIGLQKVGIINMHMLFWRQLVL